MTNERRTQWMCLFLEDLKTYAAERGLLETAAAIEVAVTVAERELADKAIEGPTDEPMSGTPSTTDRDKLQ